MNGAEVFTFGLRQVPTMVSKVLASAKWNIDEVDSFIFHQANRFILDYLCKKMKLPIKKVPYSLKDFGNTSSASIPLTITHKLRQAAQPQKMRLLLTGFGVGFSWGTVAAVETDPLVMPKLEVIK